MDLRSYMHTFGKLVYSTQSNYLPVKGDFEWVGEEDELRLVSVFVVEYEYTVGGVDQTIVDYVDAVMCAGIDVTS